jgi:hypothetical protein
MPWFEWREVTFPELITFCLGKQIESSYTDWQQVPEDKPRIAFDAQYVFFTNGEACALYSLDVIYIYELNS